MTQGGEGEVLRQAEANGALRFDTGSSMLAISAHAQ